MRFWIPAGIWTLLSILSQFINKLTQPSASPAPAVNSSTGFTVPAVDLYLWFVCMLAIYFISGIHIIKEWNRRPFLRFGKYLMDRGGGLTWVEPAFTTALGDVSTKEKAQELKVPDVLTHDNVPISFDLILTGKIDGTKVKSYVLNVDDPAAAVQKRTLATITELVGNTELDAILHNRAGLNAQVLAALQLKVHDWGISITAVELRNIKITDTEIEKAIAMKARASKEAAAELTRAAMQAEIAKKLSEAAAAMTPAGWNLKGLETLTELCRSGNNNTLLIPTHLLEALRGLTTAVPANQQ